MYLRMLFVCLFPVSCFLFIVYCLLFYYCLCWFLCFCFCVFVCVVVFFRNLTFFIYFIFSMCEFNFSVIYVLFSLSSFSFFHYSSFFQVINNPNINSRKSTHTKKKKDKLMTSFFLSNYFFLYIKNIQIKKNFPSLTSQFKKTERKKRKKRK